LYAASTKKRKVQTPQWLLVFEVIQGHQFSF